MFIRNYGRGKKWLPEELIDKSGLLSSPARILDGSHSLSRAAQEEKSRS